MHPVLLAFLLAVAAGASAQVPQVGKHQVQVVNDSGNMGIIRVRFRVAGDTEWGPNQLDEGTEIGPKTWNYWTLPKGEKACKYDVLAVAAEVPTLPLRYEFSSVDICKGVRVIVERDGGCWPQPCTVGSPLR